MQNASTFANLEQALRASIGDAGFVLLALAVAALVTWLVLRVATKAITKALNGTAVGSVSLFVNIARFLVILFAVYFVGENVLHVELGGIVQALGITSLVVSLGLQDLIKNVVAGIQIVGTRLFVAGDHIETNGERGEVVDINWRQTTVRNKDGDPVIIPNAQLMGGAFVRRDGKMARRYDLTCDIKPGLDLDRVAADIERLADEVLSARGWRAEETQVRFLGSTANGVVASIRLFLLDVEYMAPAQDAVTRLLSQRGYLADWTNESPAQEEWR